MKERILITGYNGELGSKALKELVSIGKSIIALDINNPKEKIHSVKYIKDSITNNELINSIFNDYHITEVYHFAALLSQTASQNPKLAFEINEKASKNLIDCSYTFGIKNNCKTRFFFPSSIAVYGPRKIENASEQDIIKPTTIYGNNKLIIEQYGSKLHEESLFKKIGLDFRSIRFPGVISYDTVPSGGTTDYAPQMINCAKKGEKFECKLSPNTKLPFIGIDKTISSIIDIMNLEIIESKLRVFNVQEASFSVEQLSDFLVGKFPSFKIKFNEDKNFQSVADTWPSSLNCEKAKKFWNFSSNISLEEFLNSIINK
ncbi:MAG: L-threonine 3-dehydrogenase [Candidatus Neomarinimicrobiota bacterium]|nr:MAG: L-threonine 3-dehydrogenase [Candidatus Neomarinimicrobiota bacterium]